MGTTVCTSFDTHGHIMCILCLLLSLNAFINILVRAVSFVINLPLWFQKPQQLQQLDVNNVLLFSSLKITNMKQTRDSYITGVSQVNTQQQQQQLKYCRKSSRGEKWI